MSKPQPWPSLEIAITLAMISDQADDDQKAAQKAYGHDPAAAKTFVSTYVERRSAAFSKQLRADIEHFIDACPQPDA